MQVFEQSERERELQELHEHKVHDDPGRNPPQNCDPGPVAAQVPGVGCYKGGGNDGARVTSGWTRTPPANWWTRWAAT